MSCPAAAPAGPQLEIDTSTPEGRAATLAAWAAAAPCWATHTTPSAPSGSNAPNNPHASSPASPTASGTLPSPRGPAEHGLASGAAASPLLPGPAAATFGPAWCFHPLVAGRGGLLDLEAAQGDGGLREIMLLKGQVGTVVRLDELLGGARGLLDLEAAQGRRGLEGGCSAQGAGGDGCKDG